MKEVNKYSNISLFFAGVGLSIVIISGLGTLVGYTIERALEGNHSIFTYALYVFVVGGAGGVIAVGLKNDVRIATGGGILLILGLVGTASPRPDTSIIHLTSRVGAAFVSILFTALIESSIVNYGKVRSAMRWAEIRVGVLIGVAYAVLFVVARALTGAYEEGLWNTITMNPSSMAVAIWSIGGLFVVGFVAGWLMERHSLILPLLVTSALFAIIGVFTWTRIQSRGPYTAAAADPITLFGWTWLGTLAVAVGVAVVEKGARGRFEFQRMLPEK